ncbi:MAG: gas vesicle protein GvpG [Methylocystis silviterrae]
MIIIDSLLAAPLRGLMFVLEKIDEAVQKEIEAEEQAVMADLSALHRALDSGAMTEAEFDMREQKLLDRLDRLHSEGGSDAHGDASS